MSEEIIDGSPLQESAEYVREKAGNYCGTSPKGINDRQVLLTALCGISSKVSPKWGAWAVWGAGAKQALLRSQHKMVLLSVLRIG